MARACLFHPARSGSFAIDHSLHSWFKLMQAACTGRLGGGGVRRDNCGQKGATSESLGDNSLSLLQVGGDTGTLFLAADTE